MGLITDVASITTIPVTSLERLMEKFKWCALHKVAEHELRNELVTDIELSIGTLYIKHDEDELKYKFIPSQSFEEELKNVIATGQSPLITEVENTLKDRVLHTYKDLF